MPYPTAFFLLLSRLGVYAIDVIIVHLSQSDQRKTLVIGDNETVIEEGEEELRVPM